MNDLIEKISPVSSDLDERIQQKLDFLTKPPGSLGRLEELAKTICRIHGKILPKIANKKIFVFAADHGVAEAGVSAFPQEVTAQMVLNFAAGGAAINVLGRFAGADIQVVDVGVKGKDVPKGVLNKKISEGTENMLKGPAMTREQAEASLQAGIEAVQTGGPIDLVAFGDMGIGNTTPATAILAAISKEPVQKITGMGTGLDEEGRQKKAAVIEKILKINQPDSKNGLDLLQKVGGFEIGAIAGGILAAAEQRIPVLVDGLIATAGALIACTLQPNCRDYLIASHCSEEPGHKKMLEILRLKAYLDFNMRLGEGTGAALLMNFAEASIKILNEMATFDSAGVSEKNERAEIK